MKTTKAFRLKSIRSVRHREDENETRKVTFQNTIDNNFLMITKPLVCRSSEKCGRDFGVIQRLYGTLGPRENLEAQQKMSSNND